MKVRFNPCRAEGGGILGIASGLVGTLGPTIGRPKESATFLPDHVGAAEDGRAPGRRAAFSLLEVMIALGIFFMAVFTILALVSNTLRNARALQRPMIDAGMVAAQYVNTNRFSEGTMSGDFDDDNLQDYSWSVETFEAGTNGLLRADVVLEKRGLNKPAEVLEILVFDPNFRSTPFSGGTLGPRTNPRTR